MVSARVSSFSNLARPGSGARLNKKQYAEWLRRYRRHDKLEAALKRIANCEAEAPGLASEFYGHAKAIAIEALKEPNAEDSEGGTRDSRIETAAQSRPSLH